MALKLLVYLNHTAEYGIVYDFSNCPPVKDNIFSMVAFADSDWGAREGDCRSTSGWMIQLDGSPIFAASKAQRRPALSTAEAETNALELVCKEIEWTKGFVEELGYKLKLPIPVKQDNAAAIRLANEPVNAGRTKYFRISQSYIRWCVKTGLILPTYLESKEHPCDLLNKVTSKHTMIKHTPAVIGSQTIGSINLARWKQCARASPSVRRKFRLLGSRFASKSDTNPPLACRCNKCKTWFPWIKNGQRWRTCWERENHHCDNNDDVTVQCFACSEPAVPVPGLERQWSCRHCPTRRLLRDARRIPKY